MKRLILTLLASSAVSVALLLARFIATGHMQFGFMVWNLILCWIPLGAAWWLSRRLKTTRWLTAENVAITGLWLAFLPNAFYIVSDLIHLRVTGEISILFDVVMLVSFTWNGFVLGYISLYMVHQELRKRFGVQRAWGIVSVVLLLCSFAIYLGRYLRWNSWDILINPAGLLFDVTDPLVNPGGHPQVFTTTLMFFILLTSIYAVGYQLVAILRSSPKAR